MLCLLLLLSGALCSLAAEVCYPPCGCFSDEDPFDHVPLPQSPGSGIRGQNLKWLLYTPLNRDDPVVIDYDEVILPDIYNPNTRTVFILHGWNSSPSKMESFKNIYIDSGLGYNVIILDWTGGQGIQYWLCASNARVAGACSAHVAQELAVLSGSSVDNMQCLGTSLGAQACGYMGAFTNGTIGRITGLDPAGPWFKKDDPRVRLDKSDGKFVDILHTTGGNISLGLYENTGDVDFYPNKGYDQPPCVSEDIKETCDHLIVGDYFRASILEGSCSFLAYPCESEDDADAGLCESCEEGVDCQKMGHFADTMPGRGTYYLRTTEDYPYCEN